MCIPLSFARTGDGVKDSHCLPRVIPRLAHVLLRRDRPYRSSAIWGTGEQPYYSPSILSSAAPPWHLLMPVCQALCIYREAIEG